MSPAPVLVVGYGNPLRGDDGVGQEVAEALLLEKGRDPELAGVSVECAHQLVPEMALDLSAAAFAVFVDAASDGREAGLVTSQPVTAPPGAGATSPTPGPAGACWQDLTPSGLLALARGLYGRTPPAVVVSVGVQDVGLGIGLSPSVQEAVPRAVGAVRRAIEAAGTSRSERPLSAQGGKAVDA
jgi:hydrogenase maturation protease